LNISLRSRRRRTAVGGTVLAAALGGLAAALPAQASAGPPAASARIGIAGAAAPRTVCPVSGCTPAPVISDSLNPNGVTAPDAILSCATSQIAIGGTSAVVVPVGCLTLYNGEWVKVAWTDYVLTAGHLVPTLVTEELNLQTDGNLVFNPGNGVTPWSSGTTFKGSAAGGPGCLAQFQSSANLVVSNCNGTSIWNSATQTHPGAVLAFQQDGNLVIYENSAGTPLWASKT
jgi:hypothetical protein